MGNDSSGDEILGWAKRRNEGLIFSSYGALILRLLKPDGRAAIIVPDRVLFGSLKAHEMSVNECQ